MRPMLYRTRFRRLFCGGLLAAALLLRVLSAPSEAALLLQKSVKLLEKLPIAEAAFFLETGVRLPQDTQPQRPATETVPPAAAETETEPAPAAVSDIQPTEPAAPPPTALMFSAQEAENITFRGNCTYTVDKQALLTAPLSWTAADGPQVLIVHSHTSESYTPSDGYEYEASGDYRTLDNSRNVVAVGDALAASLEAAGISVIHDTTCHDYPSYNSAYANSRQTIERELAEHPSLVTVLDIHRDAAEEVFRETAEVEEQTAAKLMLVVGTDEGGLSHPFWKENLSFALKLQALANRDYPELFKSIALRASRFNQDETPASVIVEVGSTGNTLPEALLAAEYLGKAVAALLSANQ